MRTRSVKLASAALLVAACGSSSESQPVAPRAVPMLLEAATLAKPDPIVKGAPHGSDVIQIAVTEQGDAALTADAINSVRLWPSLDGTRTPVPVSFPSEVAQLAITHAGRDLVAVLRDRGGAITVIRLGLDGSVRGRVQLGGVDAAFEEVVTADDQIVTRTADHAIEWYAVDGTLRARRVLDPGQRVTDLAARHGRLAAIVSEKDASYLRWFTISDNAIRLEPMVALPLTPREDMFAIAPDRRRIAFVDGASTGVYVIDFELVPMPLAPQSSPFVNASYFALGFVDNDTVAIAGNNVQWWAKGKPTPPSVDPWVVPDSGPMQMMSGMLPVAAFGDDLVVSSQNGSLVLGSPRRLDYLGWETSASGGFVATNNQLVLAHSGAKFTWLDDDLQKLRAIDLQKRQIRGQSWTYGQPIGDHHMVAQTHFDEVSTLEVIDADQADVSIPILERTQIEQYFVGDSVLAVKTGKHLRRFKLDLVTNKAVEQLPKVRITDYSMSFVRGFDPDLANGLVAVALTWPREFSEHQTLTYYRLVKGKITQQRVKKFTGQIIHASPTGELVVYNGGAPIQVIKDGVVVRTISRAGLALPLVTDTTATQFATREASDIVSFDDKGVERWRKPFWGAGNFMFTRSGKRLIVAASGGLVAMDAATGEQLTRECGFEFGLHTGPTDFGPHGFTTVCEDPIVQ